MSQAEVLLLLGSNLGNPKKNIEIALKMLEKEAGTILTKSKFLETKPVEFVSLNNFYNFALILSSHLSPISLLRCIKNIERNMGRTSDSATIGKYNDRIIDIDIVKYSDIVFISDKLKIPHHKHLYEREFSKILIDNLDTRKT